jgi:hypothetical protein
MSSAFDPAAGQGTYEILDGVRRRKAAMLAGRTTIFAEIVDSHGSTIGRAELSLVALRSPKTSIDVSSPSKSNRWLDCLNRTLAGSHTPDVPVMPESRGTPIAQVTIDRSGQP